jgi:hypothetical protein
MTGRIHGRAATPDEWREAKESHAAHWKAGTAKIESPRAASSYDDNLNIGRRELNYRRAQARARKRSRMREEQRSVGEKSLAATVSAPAAAPAAAVPGPSGDWIAALYKLYFPPV